MKRCIIILYFIFASVSLFAQVQGEELEIEIVLDDKISGPVYRAPAVIPITCYYYPEMETVTLSFTQNLGSVDVTVSYLTSGDVEYCQQTGAGLTVIPLQDYGLIKIDILTDSGKRYHALFYAVQSSLTINNH